MVQKLEESPHTKTDKQANIGEHRRKKIPPRTPQPGEQYTTTFNAVPTTSYDIQETQKAQKAIYSVDKPQEPQKANLQTQQPQQAVIRKGNPPQPVINRAEYDFLMKEFLNLSKPNEKESGSRTNPVKISLDQELRNITDSPDFKGMPDITSLTKKPDSTDKGFPIFSSNGKIMSKKQRKEPIDQTEAKVRSAIEAGTLKTDRNFKDLDSNPTPPKKTSKGFKSTIGRVIKNAVSLPFGRTKSKNSRGMSI